MDITLTPVEIRVLGSLLEKEAATPENYPLSLNALTNACNQKTSREPVMELSETTVLDAVESLIKKSFATSKSSAGSRVAKYGHRLSNRLREEYNFSPPELTVLCILFLRGPQTIGEIRTRSSRMHGFSDMFELEQTLNRLAQREDGPFVIRLERQPGQKELRYMHLFGDQEYSEAAAAAVYMPATDGSLEAGILSDDSARITELEFKVQALNREVAELKQRLEEFIRQFE
jgi:uncharacterized protein YceH (UPF0502 family)